MELCFFNIYRQHDTISLLSDKGNSVLIIYSKLLISKGTKSTNDLRPLLKHINKFIIL